MLTKLKTSLLTAQHAASLRLEPHTEDHKLDIHPTWAGFKIPYFLPTGKVHPTFWRFRFVQDRPSSGWGSLAAAAKPRRYAQPKDSGCGVYLPPLLGKTTWAKVMEDPKIPVGITEGELKAACACANAVLPVLGLGGVYNWRSAAKGVELIPELEAFKWESREVVLIFDSDMRTNPMVAMAAAHLARVLTDRGANVRQVNWQAEDVILNDTKVGLDDYAFQHGLEALSTLIENAKPVQHSFELHRLNTEVSLISSTNEIVELASGNVITARQFTDVAYKHRNYVESKTLPDGSVTNRQISAAKSWLEWPFRSTVGCLTYQPGEKQITECGDYNTWTGWACQPATKGTITPWEDLFGVIMQGAKTEDGWWLRRWLAYPLQFPGTKLASAVLLWGVEQGTGKTLLGETMRRIYGANYRTISSTDLVGSYTDWAANRQFIVGNEISVGNRRAHTDVLKDIITREQVTINVKYRAHYVVRDCINYYFTSNHPDAFFLENADRRYFVHEVAGRPQSNGFYDRYVKWLDHEGGAARLFHYLTEEVDCSTFESKAPAPMTQSKVEMIMDGKSDVADWCHRLRTQPETVLVSNGKALPFALFTAQDLLRLYDPQEHGRVSANGLARELKNAGLRRLANGYNNVTVAGSRVYLWAVRDYDKYARATATDLSKAYAAERDAHAGPKFAGREKRVN
jgi:hypothetical protein